MVVILVLFWAGPLQLGLWIFKFVIPGIFFPSGYLNIVCPPHDNDDGDDIRVLSL